MAGNAPKLQMTFCACILTRCDISHPKTKKEEHIKAELCDDVHVSVNEGIESRLT